MCLVWLKKTNFFYYLTYFYYYSWVPLNGGARNLGRGGWGELKDKIESNKLI